jgi:chromosomal replication initiator protein
MDDVVDIPLSVKILATDDELRCSPPSPHFLAGPENRLVKVAVDSLMNDSADGYNPLVLYGQSGVGKSHVACGLAAAWKAGNRRHRVVLTTAVDFARELTDAIESQSVEEFRVKYRTADLLVFEDLGQLVVKKSGKLSVQEEFIHTLDALLAEDRLVVVTASAAPVELPGLLPALQSRLTAGLAIELVPPGAEARLAVLRQLAKIHEVEMPERVARMLADSLSGTVPELAGALIQLTASDGFETVKTLELDSVKKYLRLRNKKDRPSIHEIALATAKHFSIRLTDLRSPVRRRALVTARGVAVYIARYFGGESLQDIGRYFGGRDHTTVMHSYQKTEELLEHDPTVHEAVELLRKQLWKK